MPEKKLKAYLYVVFILIDARRKTKDAGEMAYGIENSPFEELVPIYREGKEDVWIIF